MNYRIDLNYMDMCLEDTERNVGDAERVEKYYNERKDSYEVVVRSGRFEKPVEHIEDLSERDADQLLEASKETDILKVL